MSSSSAAIRVGGSGIHALAVRAGGFLLLALAVGLLLSLATYHSADPSLNRATAAPVHNFGGILGATVADLTLQVLGAAGMFIVLALGAWGWRLVRGEDVRRVWLRVCACLCTLVLLATLLSHISPPVSWPLSSGLGGAIGALAQQHLTAFLPGWLVATVALLAALPLVPLALGLKSGEWRAMSHLLLRVGGYALDVLRLIRDAIRGEVRERVARTQSKTGKTPQSKAAAGDGPRIFSRARNAGERQTEKTEKIAPIQAQESKVVRNARREQKKQASLELRLRQGDYTMPSYSLLKSGEKAKRHPLSDNSLQKNAKLLATVLKDFGIKGEIVNIRPGPVVTLYELEPSPGTKSSRVVGLADDIARSMSAISTRIAVIPGRNAIGIELPNRTRETVYLRDLLEDEIFTETETHLPLALGRDIGGTPMVVDLARMPHLLVAGTTGSGKSVAINTMIMSLVYQLTPEQCKFIMIDPKMLELSVYEGIPHLLTPVVTEPAKAVVALKWVVKEMENRYRLMATLSVRNIDNYNKRIREAKKNGEELEREVQTGFNPETGRPTYETQPIEMEDLPYIVVIVDEMADLMLTAGKEIEGSIQRLAQMARAAGIHLIMATQRPSVDVITGVIKANFPTRISFQVTSKIDSRTVLGEQGAEQLLGQGDMLYMAGGGRITRIHGPFASDKEVEQVVKYLKSQGAPNYIESVTVADDEDGLGFEDEEESEEDKQLYDRAVAIVARERKASTSFIQRCLKIGYNRAARLIDKMERDGVVSPANHVGKREVLLRGAEE